MNHVTQQKESNPVLHWKIMYKPIKNLGLAVDRFLVYHSAEHRSVMYSVMHIVLPPSVRLFKE